MKILLVCAAIMMLGTAAAAQSPTKIVNFSGTWLLDNAQSKGLPEYYKSVKSHKLNIRHDKSSLTVDVKITNEGQSEPYRVTAPYRLGGSESTIELPIRVQNGVRTVPTTLTASQGEDGRMRVKLVHHFGTIDKPQSGEMVEEWVMSPDGNSFLIHLVRDSPSGKMKYDMLFVRQ